MRNQKAFLLAAIVLVSSPIAGADLILTLNGYDLSDSPLIQNLGELLVAVEGTTQIDLNDVSVGAVGGVLEPVPEQITSITLNLTANQTRRLSV